MRFLDVVKPGKLVIGGHKGHQSAVQENTIPNFAEVKSLGVPYVEIDVQLTRDDQAVIFHDPDLCQQTSLAGPVREHTLSAMRAALPVNTLPEALKWCAEQGMPVLLEIKNRRLSDADKVILADQVIEAIQHSGIGIGCVPLCMDIATLQRIKAALPKIDLALIVPSAPSDPVALMQSTGASLYLSYLDDLNPPLVDTLHHAGYYVDGSIVNTREQLLKAMSLGVDMVESDHPDQIMMLYQQLQRA